jgi:putative ABC transport system permease protein
MPEWPAEWAACGGWSMAGWTHEPRRMNRGAPSAAVTQGVRTPAGLALRLARQWWPQVAALSLACGVVTATIVGALGVGDGVQRGLEQLARERLGGIRAAVLADDLFTDRLASNVAAGLRDQAGVTAVPAIVLEVTVEAGTGGPPTRATLLACDDIASLGFAAARPDQPPQSDKGSGVSINQPLAVALAVGAGDPIVLRIPRRSKVPADSPLGRRDAGSDGRRLQVARVLPDAGLGRFALRPVQATAPLVVTSLATARGILRSDAMANAVFICGAASPELTTVATHLQPTLADYGLSLEAEPPGGRSLRLTSRRLILAPEVDQAVAPVLAPVGGKRSLAFLAVSLSPHADGDALPTAAVPYSTVLGIDTSSLPVGDLVNAAGAPLPCPGADEIIVNQWLADDLAAQGRPIAVGDMLDVQCFLPETLHGRVEETTATFRICGIAAMRGAAVARELVPDVAGITDEDSIADWDPPFPFEPARVRTTPPHDEDDRYWKDYRATPKAFVSLAAAERLAGSRFGLSTAWHVPTGPNVDVGGLRQQLAAALRPESLGIRLVPLRAEALAAARGSTPFGGLFLALSSFVIAAGLVLVWLLFRLLVTARRHDIGLLAAVGWPPGRLTLLLVRVGAVAAVIGLGLGLVLGPAWAAALRSTLARAWTTDVASGAAAVFAPGSGSAQPAAVGAAAAFVVSLAALAAAAWRTARLAPLAVLRGGDSDASTTAGRADGRHGVTLGLAITAVVASLAIAGTGVRAEGAAATGAFFGSGVAALTGMLAAVRLWLVHARRHRPVRTLMQFARRGLAHRPGRALAVATIVGIAQFLIVAVSAFALRPPVDPSDRHSPTGGWTAITTFGEPTAVNPSAPEMRERLGLGSEAADALAACDIALLRSSGGDDASCTNLYAAARPTVIGVGPGFVTRGGFRFLAQSGASDAATTANPWLLLDRDPDAGPIPVVLDQATAQWALRVGGIGSRFNVTGDEGAAIPCEVVGLIDGGILQGFVIVSERSFARMFPARSGYGLALIDDTRVAAARRADVGPALATAWADAVVTTVSAGERLRQLQAVQNTFLAGFQALAALGLLLGTVGVAAVQTQGLLERLDTLAVLKAVGFVPAMLRRLLVGETLLTVGLGLAAGSLAGCLAITPLLLSGTGRVPLGWMAVAGGLTLATAGCAALVTAASQAIPDRPREN